MSPRPIVLLLSGPNLNLLGEREPEIYGTSTLAEHVAAARKEAERSGLDLEHVQSNAEADLVEAVQRARGRCAAIIVNAAALTRWWSFICRIPTAASRGATHRSWRPSPTG